MQHIISRLKQHGFIIAIPQLLEIHRMLLHVETSSTLFLGLRALVCRSKREQDFFDLLMQDAFSQQSTELQPPPDDLLFASYLQGPTCQMPGLSAALLPQQKLLSFHSPFKLAITKLFHESPQSAAQHIVNRYLLAGSNAFDDVLSKRESIMQQINEMLETLFPKKGQLYSAVLQEAVNVELAELIEQQFLFKSHLFTVQGLAEKNFLELQHTPELQQVLIAFGKKLAARNKRKRVRAQQRINFRKTFRHNLQYGGKLLQPVYERRKYSKPRLIVLTDVSPSTIYATRLFLTIIGQMKEVFGSLKLFEFIGSTIETTDQYLKAHSIPEAVDAVISKWETVQQGKQSSDYHRALKEFMDIAHLNRQHTIIILGDMRDWLGSYKGGIPLSASLLQEISRQVKQVYVFNPEAKEQWNRGDSIVQHVQNVGIPVYETKNLNQLTNQLARII